MPNKTSIIVRNYHIDHFGHLNHGRLIELLEEARWRYLENNSLIDAIHRIGAIHVVAELKVRYLRPATIGDVLFFETHIENRTQTGFWVNQKVSLKKSKKRIAEAAVLNVFIHDNGTPKKICSEILNIWPDLAHSPLSQKHIRNRR